MQIVIDIPEDTHERITKPDRLFTDDDINKVCWAVYNGTVLPKHSRLIEEDRLIERLEKLSDDKWNQEVGASKGLDFAIEIVESEPTILEATK